MCLPKTAQDASWGDRPGCLSGCSLSALHLVSVLIRQDYFSLLLYFLWSFFSSSDDFNSVSLFLILTQFKGRFPWKEALYFIFCAQVMWSLFCQRHWTCIILFLFLINIIGWLFGEIWIWAVAVVLGPQSLLPPQFWPPLEGSAECGSPPTQLPHCHLFPEHFLLSPGWQQQK